jgi:hypothetical protein
MSSGASRGRRASGGSSPAERTDSPNDREEAPARVRRARPGRPACNAAARPADEAPSARGAARGSPPRSGPPIDDAPRAARRGAGASSKGRKRSSTDRASRDRTTPHRVSGTHRLGRTTIRRRPVPLPQLSASIKSPRRPRRPPGRDHRSTGRRVASAREAVEHRTLLCLEGQVGCAVEAGLLTPGSAPRSLSLPTHQGSDCGKALRLQWRDRAGISPNFP